MRPLFVSYKGRWQGQEAQGWVVLDQHPPIVDQEDVIALSDLIESERKYDTGSLILIGFQRLEAK